METHRPTPDFKCLVILSLPCASLLCNRKVLWRSDSLDKAKLQDSSPLSLNLVSGIHERERE